MELRYVVNDPDDFNPEDFDPGNLDESLEQIENHKCGMSHAEGQVQREKSGRRKRWVNGETSRLKSKYEDEDKIIRLALKNPNKMRILRVLYIHRQLDLMQISRLLSPNIKQRSVGNLLSEMYSQNLLGRDTLIKTYRNKGDEKKFHYRLAKLGLYIIAMFDMKTLWVYDNMDQPKQHYTLQNLTIGGQERHHYETQEFITRLLQLTAEQGIYFPHTEWRRYPIEDPRVEGKSAFYRPDWFLFKPNEFYTSLVKENRVMEDPLHIPVESRQDDDVKVLGKYTGFVSIECDLKTEDLREIEDKCKKFKYSLGYYPNNNMAFFSVNGWKEKELLSKSHNQKRGRSVRSVLLSQLEEEMVSGKTNVIHGDEYICLNSLTSFIKCDGNFANENHRSTSFTEWMNALELNNDLSLLHFTQVLKSIELNPPLPIFPDEVIRVEGNNTAETHFLIFTRLGWVNPLAKALKLQQWIDAGNQKAKVVLVYPNFHELDNDIHLSETPLFYANWEELSNTKELKNYKVPVYRRIKRRLSLIWEDVNII
ncbi:replication-relaxation family protein [Paenibacillus tepidiphilus]|uniref:replication-relaxation family protein n=1 Tax=Paenibacillus tepidiphilus TaxID=2608683 RepID=UPI0012396B99|nr:replication-relaxation family protein [Paenibacillus tepidiphilus]